MRGIYLFWSVSIVSEIVHINFVVVVINMAGTNEALFCYLN